MWSKSIVNLTVPVSNKGVSREGPAAQKALLWSEELEQPWPGPQHKEAAVQETGKAALCPNEDTVPCGSSQACSCMLEVTNSGAYLARRGNWVTEVGRCEK